MLSVTAEIATEFSKAILFKHIFSIVSDIEKTPKIEFEECRVIEICTLINKIANGKYKNK